MSGLREYAVTSAEEQNGFARCRDIATGVDTQCDLYVPISGELLRVHVDDRISGEVHGTVLQLVAILKQAPPPASLVEELIELRRELSGFEVVLPDPIEPFAQHLWRYYKKQSPDPLAALVAEQLTQLFDWSDDHPLEDCGLVSRLASATARAGSQVNLVEKRDENGDLEGFEDVKKRSQVPMGQHGDWEQPVGCFAPVVEYANQSLEAARSVERWCETGENYVLADPELVEMLFEKELVAPPEQAQKPKRWKGWLGRLIAKL
ncbi:MAG: hypothetical protein GY811_13605 [Myxococcales bacterium]|nr:hypothetical protein [Myxococcales bacterium]